MPRIILSLFSGLTLFNQIDKLRKIVVEVQKESTRTANQLTFKTSISLADFYKRTGVIHEYLIYSLMSARYAAMNDEIGIANMYIEDMNKVFPVDKIISTFHKAHVLRELFDLKHTENATKLDGLHQLFLNINVGLRASDQVP